MKKCPRCGQIYTEDNLNFCLNDGELLSYMSEHESGRSPDRGFADDSPPTLVLDPSRVTNQSWQSAQPPAHWQNPAPASQTQPFGLSPFQVSKDKTLPTISLVLAIISCFMVCCAGGIWLGLPAAVLGYLGMRNADSDANRYGGRGLAIAGMVIGIVTFLASLVFLLISAID
jgi:hypothetical protein